MSEAFIGEVRMADGEGKAHVVAVYQAGTHADKVTRRHPNWPREYFAVLTELVDEKAFIATRMASIFQFGEQQRSGVCTLRIKREEKFNKTETTITSTD